MGYISNKSLFVLILGSLCWFPISAQHRFRIDQAVSFQTIDGFGASDAWSNDFLLKMNDSLKNLAADLLFSRSAAAEGSFQGIGLSVWRHNLGTGSSEQGDNSGIGDSYRRTECCLDSSNNFDGTKQSAVRWMIKAAKKRGLEKLVLFSNSPPVFMTKNNRSYTSICGESNLKYSDDAMFADFLAESVRHFEKDDIHPDYVSPVNEPEWGWCQRDGQEGCPYRNGQVADIARKLDKALSDKGLGTELMCPESGLLIFANSGMRFKPGRENHIKDFFDAESDNYIGDKEHTARIICAHGYFTEWPLWLMRHVRKKLAAKCRKNDLRYWMSEYCILRKTREIEGGGRDPGMKTALYVSRVIHHDLVYGNASAWCWWLGISSADFKDGLVYTNRKGSELISTKTLWALGNYSHFIHPGAKRIEVHGRYDKEFFVSAYKNEGSDEVVMVIINMKTGKQSLEISGLQINSISTWVTSDSLSLQKTSPEIIGNRIFVSPASVTTIIINEQSPT
jgi:O-glycosyl hydrolase